MYKRQLTRKPNYEKISLTVRKGDIVGITGLLGSGRTELALTLFGLNPQDSGTMLLNGKEYRPASPTQAVEAGVSMLPEDRQTQGAYLEKSISDNTVSYTHLDVYKRQASDGALP